jgi:hypothetical protein
MLWEYLHRSVLCIGSAHEHLHGLKQGLSSFDCRSECCVRASVVMLETARFACIVGSDRAFSMAVNSFCKSTFLQPGKESLDSLMFVPTCSRPTHMSWCMHTTQHQFACRLSACKRPCCTVLSLQFRSCAPKIDASYCVWGVVAERYHGGCGYHGQFY